MCGGGGSPPPKDTYAGNGTKLGGKLSPDYGWSPNAPGDPLVKEDANPSTPVRRDESKSGANVKM